MSTAVLGRELDDLVLQLKGLVHVRALLEGEEIARVRAELAEFVKESPAPATVDYWVARSS